MVSRSSKAAQSTHFRTIRARAGACLPAAVPIIIPSCVTPHQPTLHGAAAGEGLAGRFCTGLQPPIPATSHRPGQLRPSRIPLHALLVLLPSRRCCGDSARVPARGYTVLWLLRDPLQGRGWVTLPGGCTVVYTYSGEPSAAEGSPPSTRGRGKPSETYVRKLLGNTDTPGII